MEQRDDYHSEYHRMVVTGLVDHKWAARLQKAAKQVSSESVADVLGERGFQTGSELEEALAQLDWAAIRAVAEAFDPDNPLRAELIC